MSSDEPDDWTDADEPEYAYEDDDTWNDLIPCPTCGAEIHEESVRCPGCGDYIMQDTSVWTGRSWWWIALGLLGIVAVVWALAVGY